MWFKKKKTMDVHSIENDPKEPDFDWKVFSDVADCML